MELRRRLDPRRVFIGLYAVLFAIYMVIGLQPAEAARYAVANELVVPGIGLTADVTELELENGRLNTPDSIVGSYSQAEYKTLLIGHYSTVFRNLDEVNLGDEIEYGGVTYAVKKIQIREKSAISMREVLQRADQDTLVIMTCAGQLLDNGDATHRLMITAVKV